VHNMKIRQMVLFSFLSERFKNKGQACFFKRVVGLAGLIFLEFGLRTIGQGCLL
jgi:hypothetical protein